MAESPPPSRPAAATTTAEQDLHSFGQRRINLIWEVTQALIAVVVTLATLYVAAQLALKGAGETAAFLLLSNAFFLVIGFYFSRSNHNRINDTAPKRGSGRQGQIDTR
jgi:hypothetical protein